MVQQINDILLKGASKFFIRGVSKTARKCNIDASKLQLIAAANLNGDTTRIKFFAGKKITYEPYAKIKVRERKFNWLKPSTWFASNKTVKLDNISRRWKT